MKHRSIAVAGNMGAGKSTLVDFLNTHYGVQPFFEPNDQNPYLADFYQDMPRWAFQSQLYFLSNKFRIHQEMDRAPGVTVQDRSIFEDAEIFATALREMKHIDDRDWETYWHFYQTILDAIKPPDLLIYLRCSVRTVRKRLKLRGRDMEKDVPLAYLKRLDRLYERWIENYTLSDVLILETDNLDYIQDLLYRMDVMERIEACIALPRKTA